MIAIGGSADLAPLLGATGSRLLPASSYLTAATSYQSLAVLAAVARNRCGTREKTPPTNTAIGGLSALSKAVASRRLGTFHQLVSFNPISLGARMSKFIFAGGAVAVLVILWLIGREVLRKLAPPKSQ
jgi:hypothetical protein